MKRRAFLQGSAMLGAVTLLGACASAESLKEARGEGVKRTYREAYDAVYSAVLRAAPKRKLEIVSAERQSGVVVLASGPSLGSLGERIGVLLLRLGERATSVEIVVKPIVPTISFTRDWPSLLFGEIEEEMTAQRLTR